MNSAGLSLSQKVRDFHSKYNCTLDEPLSKGGNELIRMSADCLASSEVYAAQAVREMLAGDSRLFRACLMLEELAETLDALWSGDLVKLADGLGDLAYTTEGTFQAFGLKSEPIIDEIHRSNMTKIIAVGRIKKGDDFSPPNLEALV